MAYKKNIDDTRESPSLKLLELIEKRGAKVDYYDPLIPEIPRTREHPEFAGRRSIVLAPEVVSAYDAVLISTDHDEIDWECLVERAQLIIDTRNVCYRKGLSGTNIVKAQRRRPGTPAHKNFPAGLIFPMLG